MLLVYERQCYYQRFYYEEIALLPRSSALSLRAPCWAAVEALTWALPNTLLFGEPPVALRRRPYEGNTPTRLDYL